MKGIFLFILIAGIAFSVMGNRGALRNEKMNSENLELKYLIKEPAIAQAKRRALVLLHGVGSNEEDLFSLKDKIPGDIYLICPRGGFTISQGSYAWYNVDFSSGKPVYNHQQELESRKAILKFIDQLREKYNFDEIFLGGFSQGAIMSATIGLIHPEKVKGVVCLSGRILQEIRPDIVSEKNLSHLKFFLAHGNLDGTLPLHFAKEAKEYLEKLKVHLSYHEYEMGHQVNEVELRDLNNWLEE